MTTEPRYLVPGMTTEESVKTLEVLKDRMIALVDLGLTLKHIHWNVVGPHFVAVHEMLDPQHAAVQEMVDKVAERIATLGGEPRGTPEYIASNRGWDDYELGRAATSEHLAALNLVYDGVITSHREAQKKLSEQDPVSEDLIIEHLRKLELFQWFVRAHLENSSGELISAGVETLVEAADKAAVLG